MEENALKRYLSRPVMIIGTARPAWFWMVVSVGGSAVLAGLAIGLFWIGRLLPSFFWPLPTFLLYAVFAFGFLALFLLLLRALFPALRHFLVFAIVMAALSFATNATVLNHEVFPPFTPRTVMALWMVFLVLAASIFFERVPELLRLVFQPFLTAGALLCVAFIVVLAPFMAIGWIFVWFGGLGFLPYSPLFAFLAFILSARRIHLSLGPSRKTLSWAAIGGTIFIALIYSGYYAVQWHRAEAILAQPEIPQGHNRVDQDLPAWVQKAARLPVNHVTEMVLQPNRRSSVAIFSQQSLFDPLAFLASGGMGNLFGWRGREPLTEESAGKMLHLLFGHPHAHLDRLWRGHSLITTNIDTHVQMHPQLRVSYTETTLSVFNENSASSSSRSLMGLGSRGFAGPEEAIYTITVPAGSVCTKLSLWIDGKEEPARLTFRSTARRAYETIVGAERRDPSTVEWLDGGRLRLRVFPVNPENYRTVRIGVISPLKEEDGRLKYASAQFEGPVAAFADGKVSVDLYSKSGDMRGSGLRLKEKVVPDGQVRQWRADGTGAWTLSVAADAPRGVVSAGGLSFEVSRLAGGKVDFRPDAIFVAPNQSLSRDHWKAIVRKLYKFSIPVHIVTDEYFFSQDPERAMSFLDDCNIPSFNLFPLHAAHTRGFKNALWVIAGEKHSIPLGELRGSPRFQAMQTASAARTSAVSVAVLGGRISEYTASLIDLAQVDVVATDEDGLLRIIKEARVERTSESATTTALPYAGVQLQKIPSAGASMESVPAGADLLVRLYFQRRIMRSLGQRFFDQDRDNGDLVDLARQGMIVSPVSTLIVLESEKDYKRFGIDAGQSLLGQSKLASPGAVPEPGETALLIILAAFVVAGWLAARRRKASSWLKSSF